MVETMDPKTEKVKGLETNHGYFKLDKGGPTKLDLRYYEKSRVKWLYFTAIRPKNPQRRAWLHAIRGPAFGESRLNAKLLPLTHKVVETARKGSTVTPEKTITPTAVKTHGSLDFALGKASNEHDIYVYSMQVYPHQQDLTTEPVSEKISESSDLIPPRILQSVHGFFNLRADHPTRLNLCASWDRKTVHGHVVNFYIVDPETGVPRPFASAEKPTLFGKEK